VNGQGWGSSVSHYPVAKNGRLDLSAWNFSKDGIVAINGEWHFYWQQLLEPKDFRGKDKPKPTHSVYLPGSWQNSQSLQSEQMQLPKSGYGTFLLRVKGLSSTQEALAFYQGGFFRNYRVLIFSPQETNQVNLDMMAGVVSSSPGRSTANFPRKYKKIDALNLHTYYILLQVSDFNNHSASFSEGIKLGLLSDLKLQKEIYLIRAALMIGMLFVALIYNISLFLQRREDIGSLYLAGFAFSVILRQLFTEGYPHYFYDVPSNNLGQYSLTIIIGTMATSVGLLAGFYRYNFPSFFSANFQRVGWLYILVSLTGLVLFEAGQIMLLITLVGFIIDGYIFFKVTRAAIDGDQAAKLSLIGWGILLFCIFNDILVATVPVFADGFFLGDVGLLAFIIFQSQVVGVRFAAAFRDVKSLVTILKEQERARTLFFHNTSHELRTPLNGIIGFLDLIRKNRYGEVASKAAKQIGRALDLAESLKLQINTILDLAKSKRGDLKQNIQNFSLEQMKKEADNLAEGLKLRQPGLSYQSSINALESNFIGDHEKIFTILRNLLGNAFKFKDPKRDNKISLDLNFSEHKLIIKVEDTGVGIPESSREKIFEEFGQVDGDARRSYEGTGLGLSMVHNLVKLMEGKIVCESELGRGSVFVVEIPEQAEEAISVAEAEEQADTNDIYVDRQNEDLEDKAAEQDLIIDQPGSNDWNIFVIDDTEINCEVISEILAVDGYSVRYALSGATGIPQMREKRPDLLLLDMMMPEMSGEDVLNAMKEDPLLQEVPIILITARASEEDRIFGLKIGADDYLPKPIVSAELRLRTHNMIDRHRLLRQVENATGQDKIIQLGELFGELSHELKNILSGAGFLQKISTEETAHLIKPMDLSPSNHEVMSHALLKSSYIKDMTERFKALEKGPEDEFVRLRSRLRRNLASLDLSMEQLKSVWGETQDHDPEKLGYLDSQLKIMRQHYFLKDLVDRCQELTQNVLSYTREDYNESKSVVQERFDVVDSLLTSKKRSIGVKWEVDLGDHIAGIKPNALTQVLLNLGVNALDAIEDLPDDQKWIRTQATVKEDKLYIDCSNGGPPIPQKVQKRLFERGFSTKGDKGSGIGLYVSKRIIVEAGGDLLCANDTKSPCFQLILPIADSNYSESSTQVS